ncbi:fructosamine kinase family protein [Azospirillum halopraeferens]|uniref:fructosamine kinase family protein n=1 Tax=Azospirillum halopraeferens TaxID=34010 RepID=UPI000407341B|nr:fructosamine kinase family protein [Azospirillum halopraeferens]
MTLTADRRAAIERAAGSAVAAVAPLAGGHNAVLLRVRLADGRTLVAKAGRGLEPEGFMLRHLAARTALPVPAVHHADDTLLVMDHVDGGDSVTPAAEEHAAELVAALHGVTADRYGFPRDTVIGPLPQLNGESDDWIAFFRDRRLLHMGRAALAEGRIDAALMAGLERLAARLPELIGTPAPPVLIHGDLWGGNVLVRGGRVAGFIDPALYHADAEIELAFTTLFSTFGTPFFRRYDAIRPLRPGFFEVRRDLYNLYPLLVHVRLFGGSYGAAVRRTVTRFAGP